MSGIEVDQASPLPKVRRNNVSVSSDISDDIEIVSENDPLLGAVGFQSASNSYSDHLNHGRGRRGYEQRKRLNERGNYVYPDHGTYLGHKAGNRADMPAMDNPITIALDKCQKYVLKPYMRLQLSVGWQPVFHEVEFFWQRALNVLHPVFVILLIFLGYIIQYAACFRRDRAGEGITLPWQPFNYNTSNSSLLPAYKMNPPCQHYFVSQYLIPDILHSVAYVFSFLMYRGSQSEQIPMLMEKVFLQTSPTQSGFLSQGKLIRNLRIMLYGGVFWVILSQLANIIHVLAQYKTLNFYWLEPRMEFGRIVLIIFMSFSFVMLDIVYMTVVISYCVQCFLLIFYVEGLQEKVREKNYTLKRAMKETMEIQSHLKKLNQTPGTAVSIVMVNFCNMAILGTLALFTPDRDIYTTMMYVATIMAVLLWVSIMLLPLVQAARLSAACNSLRKLGHEIKVRPFGWQDESEQELDSFLQFQSSLSMKAKILLVPIRSAYLCGLAVLTLTTLVLLFQAGALSIWA